MISAVFERGRYELLFFLTQSLPVKWIVQSSETRKIDYDNQPTPGMSPTYEEVPLQRSECA